jgi:aminoglycoside phosphotransferase (APT) family kinase protein
LDLPEAMNQALASYAPVVAVLQPAELAGGYLTSHADGVQRWVRRIPASRQRNAWRAHSALRRLRGTAWAVPSFEMHGDIVVSDVPSVSALGSSLLSEHSSEVYRAVGQSLRQLHELPTDEHFGGIADGERFYPDAEDWESHCLGRARQARFEIASRSIRSGPLAEKLVNAVRGADLSVSTFGLVHGQFTPAALWMRADPKVVVVTRWETAQLGDPLMDWAPLLLLDPGARKSVVAGYGKAPEQLRRLQAYAAIYLLERLATLPEGSDEARAAWAWARRVAREPIDMLDTRTEPIRRAGAISSVLRRVASEPPYAGGRTDQLLGVLAASRYAELDGWFPEDTVSNGVVAPPGRGYPQVKRAVRTRLLQDVVVDRVLPMVWLVLDRTDGEPSDAVWAGLARILSANLVADPLENDVLRALDVEHREELGFLYSTLSLAAAHQLQGVIRADWGPFVGRARRHNARCVQRLNLGKRGTTRVELELAIARLRHVGHEGPYATILPAVVYALEVLGPTAPARADAVVARFLPGR